MDIGRRLVHIAAVVISVTKLATYSCWNVHFHLSSDNYLLVVTIDNELTA